MGAVRLWQRAGLYEWHASRGREPDRDRRAGGGGPGLVHERDTLGQEVVAYGRVDAARKSLASHRPLVSRTRAPGKRRPAGDGWGKSARGCEDGDLRDLRPDKRHLASDRKHVPGRGVSARGPALHRPGLIDLGQSTALRPRYRHLDPDRRLQRSKPWVARSLRPQPGHPHERTGSRDRSERPQCGQPGGDGRAVRFYLRHLDSARQPGPKTHAERGDLSARRQCTGRRRRRLRSIGPSA